MECLLPFLAIALIIGFVFGIFTLMDVLFTEKFEDYFIYPFYKKWFK